MGDSYSAASGVLPLDPTAPPQCLRSTRNYPHVIASRVDVRLRDVTCGAAETNDYFEEQYDGVAPQLDALTRRTRLVTMTIGGNDQGVFIDAIVEVRHRGRDDRWAQGSPCRDRVRPLVRPHDPPADRARPGEGAATPSTAARRRAEVAILGYPWIVPRGDGLLRPDADRRGRRPLPAQPAAGAQRRRGAGRRRHRPRRTSTSAGSPTATTPARTSACAGSSRCCRAPTRSWSTPTRSASGGWPGGRSGSLDLPVTSGGGTVLP